MPCSPAVFQLPIPPLLFLIPPTHFLQWVTRGLLLCYTFIIAIPLLLLLVPLSVVLHGVNPAWAILSLHPDNLPPTVGLGKAVRRGVVVYTVGTIIWAITGIGNAPESTDDMARWITRNTCRIVEMFTSRGVHGRLEWSEETVSPIDDRHRLGAMREGAAARIGMFALRHVPSAQPASEGPQQGDVRPRAILFLAGGGYVTGTPLGHPFVFSLARLLPHSTDEGGYTVYAPCIRKSLDRARSFPIPLLDALAAYQHLRRRYAAEDITIMGDSAGGGLVWSLTAYLAVLDSVAEGRGGAERLGIPGRAILISPWLALPPTVAPVYPDLVDTPQLLNAARCYMARYPILPHRPDPFNSDWALIRPAVAQSCEMILSRVSLVIQHALPRRLRRLAKTPWAAGGTTGGSSSSAQRLLRTDDGYLDGKSLTPVQWLDKSTFQRLTSHHPLVSPSTDVQSPFVRSVLDILAANETKMLVHIGTAEWFYEPTVSFAKAAKRARLDVSVYEELGGFHSGPCAFPAELGGASGRLVGAILGWLRQEA